MRSVLGNRGKNVLYICINSWSQPLIKVFYFTHDNFCFKFSWCTFNIRYCKWGHQLLENLNLKSESEILTPILQSILNEMFSQPMGGTCQLIKKHCNNLRAHDCKYRESLARLKKSKILIICLENPFREIHSKKKYFKDWPTLVC